jgi:hypothetical protein
MAPPAFHRARNFGAGQPNGGGDVSGDRIAYPALRLK